MTDNLIDSLNFNKAGLIPAVVQDVTTLEVIMVAYMDKEAIKRTIDSKKTWFYSRSRKTYWQKGETSGNIQKVHTIKYDCDADCLLVMVEQKGVGCHTGNRTCFHNELFSIISDQAAFPSYSYDQLKILFDVIEQRKRALPDDSYTANLLKEGLEKINAKIMEESGEVVEAAEIKNKPDLIWEIADLLYHLAVLATYKEITIEEIYSELKKRSK